MGDVVPFKKNKKIKKVKDTKGNSDRKLININEKVKVDLNMITNDWGMQINMDTVFGMMMVPEAPGIALWFNDFEANEHGIPTVAYDILIPYQSLEAAKADIEHIEDIIMDYRGGYDI